MDSHFQPVLVATYKIRSELPTHSPAQAGGIMKHTIGHKDDQVLYFQSLRQGESIETRFEEIW